MQVVKKKSRAYHHGDLKAALIQAALKLIRKKGPLRFTLNEASRSAGVSVSAPYNHFRDKDALLVEIALLGSRTLRSELQAAAANAGTPKERLLAVYLAYIDFAKRYPEFFVVMFQSGIDKDPYPELRDEAGKTFAVLYDLAMETENTPRKARELAVAIWNMAHGFASLDAEGAIARAGSEGANQSAEALGRRLLS
jgi:AcrR family transcriptional regulator